MRAAQLGLRIGDLPRGTYNAITDVPGVRVGHRTIIEGEMVRTGVTVIEPRPEAARLDPCFAGVHVLNGNGDATGLEWIREAGLLTTPIAFTNTHSVGVVRDALIAAERQQFAASNAVYWCMPVVLETYDGCLNDIWGQHVRTEHVFDALQAAASGPVAEGCVGGGTGMICHEFKGGIGTASRVLPAEAGGWTVGAIVQSNYGGREALRVGGYPVGRALLDVPSPWRTLPSPGVPGMGSIVIVIATDAPLLPHQCTRLAQRASIGLARVGGGTEDSSGDIFLAFSTGNRGLPPSDYNHSGAPTTAVEMVNHSHISTLFAAAADAVEEAIVNALLAATDMMGLQGRRVQALGAERLLGALESVGWRPQLGTVPPCG